MRDITKKLLKEVSNGNISPSLRKVRNKYFWDFENYKLLKDWESIEKSDNLYIEKYQMVSKITKKVINIEKSKHPIFLKNIKNWILAAIGTIIFALLSKFAVDKVDNWQKQCELSNDCTVVVTSFNDNSPNKDYIPLLFHKILKDSLRLNTFYCPIDDRSKVHEEFLTGDFKVKNIKGEPQVIISGNYASSNNSFEGILEIDIFDRNNKLSNKLSILPSPIKIENLTRAHLGSILEKSGIFIAIMHSFKYPDKCNKNFTKHRDSITSIYQTKIDNRAIMEVIAESYYQENNFERADKNLTYAISLDSDHISNYARRGLIKDTLKKYEESFTDYTNYISNFEKSNNQLISNYKVRNFRLKMIDKSLKLNDHTIFRNDFSKRRIKEELIKDIQFYEQNKNDSLGTGKMILETEKTMNNIDESYFIVSGKVNDNFEAPINRVKIKDVQSGDSVWTDDQGRFNFSIPSSNSRLVFSKRGYERVEKNLEGSQNLNIELKHNMIEISGKATIDSKPIKDVKIQGYKDRFSTLTNRDGEYKLSVPEITSVLTAKLRGFEDQSVSIGNRLTINFTLSLKEPNVIQGIVKTKYGQAIIGATVLFNSASGTITDFDGRFILRTQDSIIRISVSSPGYKTKSVSIEPNQTNIEIILDPIVQ